MSDLSKVSVVMTCFCLNPDSCFLNENTDTQTRMRQNIQFIINPMHWSNKKKDNQSVWFANVTFKVLCQVLCLLLYCHSFKKRSGCSFFFFPFVPLRCDQALSICYCCRRHMGPQ